MVLAPQNAFYPSCVNVSYWLLNNCVYLNLNAISQVWGTPARVARGRDRLTDQTSSFELTGIFSTNVTVPATPYLCRRHRFANMNLLQLLSASGVVAVGHSGQLNGVSLFQYLFSRLLGALSICPAETGQSEMLVLPADGQVYL